MSGAIISFAMTCTGLLVTIVTQTSGRKSGISRIKEKRKGIAKSSDVAYACYRTFNARSCKLSPLVYLQAQAPSLITDF